MQTVNVKIASDINKSYEIIIDKCAKKEIKKVLMNFSAKKAVIVTNETVFELYQNTLLDVFSDISIDIEYCIIPDGEKYKNKNYLEKILTCAFEKKLERNDAFIAFGGGVIGDITGFAASIYLRGIDFIQIPTTILAQVDSSVGGKVAIDTVYGKNLIGAFYQPKAVITDLSFLNTLPKREILSGLSEVVKYAFIEKNCDSNFTDFLKFLYDNSSKLLNLDSNTLEYMVKNCCHMKAEVVNKDEKENGLRMVLNFGHTIGHAIEKCTNYSIFTHGEAISIGMKGALLLSYKMGKIDENYFEFANSVINLFGFNFKIPKDVTPEKILDALYYDKKVKNSRIRFVLPVNYAQVDIVDDVDCNLIEEVVKELY